MVPELAGRDIESLREGIRSARRHSPPAIRDWAEWTFGNIRAVIERVTPRRYHVRLAGRIDPETDDWRLDLELYPDHPNLKRVTYTWADACRTVLAWTDALLEELAETEAESV